MSINAEERRDPRRGEAPQMWNLELRIELRIQKKLCTKNTMLSSCSTEKIRDDKRLSIIWQMLLHNMYQ
jgi:hypothetical protein